MEQSESGRSHNFLVTEVVAPGEKPTEGMIVTLVDARGGRVRLHLTPLMATRLREEVERLSA